jgi:NitT/TauT family transport system substrate-binding protein
MANELQNHRRLRTESDTMSKLAVPAAFSRAAALRIGGAAVLAAATQPGRAFAQSAPVRYAASPAATQAEAYYAEQLGFFKQAGISTIGTIVARGAAAVSGVISGDYDIGSSTPPSIASAIVHGIPLRVIAPGPVYVDPPPFQLFVAKDSPIRTARDLMNSTIAVQTLNDDQGLGILAWLDQNHVDTTKVKFIEMTFPTMPAALTRGEIAAAMIVEPFISANKDVLRAIPRVYDSLGQRWAYGAWFARQDFIDKNPALVKAIATALYATAKHVNANQSEIDPLLAAYSKVTVDTARSTVKPVFAEMLEPSNFVPQLQVALKFKMLPRAVTLQEFLAK